LIASGRLSARSFPRYRRARPLLRRVLAGVAAIGARSEGDAERFVALGADPARVSVTGDLKLEPEPTRDLAPELEAALGKLPLFVAGSTHPGEEETALEALAAAEAQGRALALVLALRHVARAPAVAALARGRRVVLRSALPAPSLRPGDVLVLDSLGELGAVYARARAAFVGGTLAPGIGGHDLAEAAHAGAPVLFGPGTESTAGVAELLLASGGGERVADARELGRALGLLMAGASAASERGAKARGALASQRGATARTIALLERVLAERNV
jgi:3-deoxy-D-manno-octulosonic-acid transferase